MTMSRARSLYAVAALAVALALTASTAAGAPSGSTAQKVSGPAARSATSALPSPQLALQRALALFAPSQVRRPLPRGRRRRRPARGDPRPTRSRRAAGEAVRGGPPAGRRAPREADGRTRGRGPGRLHREGPPEQGALLQPALLRPLGEKTNERPSLRDRSPNNNRPDYVDKTIANMNDVWAHVIGAYDFKRPLRDTRSGPHHGGNPNRKIDIFIANIGNQGIYGYCTTDDPRASPSTHRKNSAYCVIDNDFRRAEFQSGAFGNNANKVTLAHEFFHAIQFAYDYFDNRAMMEGTATWMEDQVFTGVNDNRQYFGTSPLGPNPWQSLDRFFTSGPFALWPYGTWIWYRFLSENLGPGATDSPAIVRQIWVRAVGPARQGFGAIAPALAARGTTVLEQMMAVRRVERRSPRGRSLPRGKPGRGLPHRRGIQH